jgi:iron-sulfur cluster insertion protein
MIKLTESANSYLNSVTAPYVTLAVKGGGCAGFKYDWGTAEKVNGWTQISNKLLLDPIAEIYLLGATIDYISSIEGNKLEITNPQAYSSCGCGKSFGV